MAGKFYAVAKGRKPGIYTEWPEAKGQVDGFPGAVYKGFTDLAEAKAWLKNPPPYPGGPQKSDRPKKSAGAPKSNAEAAAMPSEGIVIYTDGSCLGNPGPGGYGVIILENGHERRLQGGFRHTTNNRMEIMAALVGLKTVSVGEEIIHLYSDSSYLVNAIQKGWLAGWAKRGWRKSDGMPALNRDLWQEMLPLLTEKRVVLHWLRGHAGHHYNECCDELALAAAKAANLPEDMGYQVENQP
ncbi:MAG: ribonuclease HI [Desulfobulbaceae bacterium]|nr:ribonuclease HI [Desulfobulbaceae bacterium]